MTSSQAQLFRGQATERVVPTFPVGHQRLDDGVQLPQPLVLTLHLLQLLLEPLKQAKPELIPTDGDFLAFHGQSLSWGQQRAPE